MDLLAAYSGVESDDSTSSDEPIDAGRDASDEDASGTCMLFKKDALDLYRISERKTVELVVTHDVGAGAQYLSTSEAGVAHVLEINETQCTDWFKDSPYTWGSPKGTDATTMDVGGKSVPYLVRKRSCQPPIVCSLMPAAVADRPHEVVNFEDPTWISAMNLCEADDSPERKVHKTTMAFFKTIQKMEEGGCSFKDEQGCSCGGT
ncbi:hypothetical protein I4F81_002609 [Pyropia yezoensis]|uniref:Uncharacterized protein n=1 Tax=Pyropia yezoensis TaxID=2788 RepID=A0ACC3BQ94_PYRYE|nr:hypothetical protein I4F81_002609 [Neopyropia yezoensis]